MPTNAHSSHNESQLYIFEDNEAVIKMIIKRRIPTMTHTSRTHRVALDWLFERINLEPKIQIKSESDVLKRVDNNSLQASRQLVLENRNQTESYERKYSDSKTSRKLAASSPKLKNMEYTNHHHMSKIFQCLHKKLGMSATNATFPMDTNKTHVLIWRIVYDLVDESHPSSWAEFQVEF